MADELGGNDLLAQMFEKRPGTKVVLDSDLTRQLRVKDGQERDCLPTQRRSAVTFRYDGMDVDTYGMTSVAAMIAPENRLGEENDTSSVYRKIHTVPTDSWEIDLCIGLALRLAVLPNWQNVQRLGRSLMVLKVHKQPAVCEIFWMKRDDVVATYKERMPRTLEWVHLYDPNTEVALWAELYQPSTGRRAAGKSSATWLTDELCGGFGTRFCLKHYLQDDKKLGDIMDDLDRSQEEKALDAAAASDKIEKKKAKKARQKANKAESKKAEDDAAQQAEKEKEEAEVAAMKAKKIAAPSLLSGFNWKALSIS